MSLTIMKLLKNENTGLLVVDVQEKLMPVMERREWVIGNILKLLHLAKLLALPVILTDHHGRWLGPTLPEIMESVPAYEPITKFHFNCCDVGAFKVSIGKTINGALIAHCCPFRVHLMEKRGALWTMPQ